jgi:hypothetical protein
MDERVRAFLADLKTISEKHGIQINGQDLLDWVPNGAQQYASTLWGVFLVPSDKPVVDMDWHPAPFGEYPKNG